MNLEHLQQAPEIKRRKKLRTRDRIVSATLLVGLLDVFPSAASTRSFEPTHLNPVTVYTPKDLITEGCDPHPVAVALIKGEKALSIEAVSCGEKDIQFPIVQNDVNGNPGNKWLGASTFSQDETRIDHADNPWLEDRQTTVQVHYVYERRSKRFAIAEVVPK